MAGRSIRRTRSRTRRRGRLNRQRRTPDARLGNHQRAVQPKRKAPQAIGLAGLFFRFALFAQSGRLDVKPEDRWQAIDFPLVRLLSAKNVLRSVLNRAAAEYAGAICGHELRVGLINYPFADGLDDASTLWIHARDFALGGSGYAETLTDVRSVGATPRTPWTFWLRRLGLAGRRRGCDRALPSRPAPMRASKPALRS